MTGGRSEPTWDSLWAGFREDIDDLDRALGLMDDFAVRLDRSANDRFPLRATASYSPRSSPGDERLVVSLDVKREGGRIVGSVDLARGDGRVLARQQVVDGVDERTIVAEQKLRDAAQAVTRFVTENRSVIDLELRGSPR